MAGKMNKDTLQCRFTPWASGNLCVGNTHYRFFQNEYFGDFLNSFCSSLNKTNEKIAELLLGYDEDGKDYSRTVGRYNNRLLFGSTIDTKGIQGKLVDMLRRLQENKTFNPDNHIYIEKIEPYEKEKFHYCWEDSLSKWKDISNYSNKQKNQIIAGQIYELLDIMTESDFYNLKPIDQSDAENDYYNTLISEIYSIIDNLYLDAPKLNEKWISIMKTVEGLIHRHEFPGIYDDLWIRANEAITYFDIAYDIAESNLELFERVKNGTAGFGFCIDINQDMIRRRKKYMHDKKQQDVSGNTHRSEVQLLEEEMKTALKRILSSEFKEAL